MLKTRLSVRHKPPQWVIRITAVLALLVASKAILITQLPIKNTDLLETVGKWYDYIMDTSSVIFSILCICLGVVPDGKKN